jgi:hypothetical protein
MLWRSLFIATCVWMTTACASLVTQSPDPTLEASLRQPCPDLPPLADGTAATVLRWITETAEAYEVCQSRHARTVEAWPTKEK